MYVSSGRRVDREREGGSLVHLSFTRGLSTSIQLETQRATRPHSDFFHPSSYGLWCISSILPVCLPGAT